MNHNIRFSSPVIGAIIEVRMTSSRLPGKHMLESNGIPMIVRLLRRVKSISRLDRIVLATTANAEDDVFVAVAKQEGVDIFRGSEDDVMARVLQSAVVFDIDLICEITGDCPLVDVQLTQEAIDVFLNNDIDYLNNGTSGLPDGLGCQLFTTRALEISYNLTNKSLDFEHVTAHIIRNSMVFRSLYPNVPTSLFWPEVSFSLDEQDDYRFLNEIILNCEDKNFFFGTKTVIDFLRNRPDLVQMNSEIRRRGYE